jgi:hypothetical protein
MMKNFQAIFLFLFFFIGCKEIESEPSDFSILKVEVGVTAINLTTNQSIDLAVDRPILLYFSQALDESSIAEGVRILNSENTEVNLVRSLSSDRKILTLRPVGALQFGMVYTIDLNEKLRSSSGNSFSRQTIRFRTVDNSLNLQQFEIEGGRPIGNLRVIDANLSFRAVFTFSAAVDRQTVPSAFHIAGPAVPALQFRYSENDHVVEVSTSAPLPYLSKFEITIRNTLRSISGLPFSGFQRVFYTGRDGILKFPLISDEALLDLVQRQTFKYFWDFAHPNSGMIRERNTSGNLVTMGGSGFGVMAILVGIERGFISRNEGIQRIGKIVDFLERADRFHGAWPHWLDGNTGKTIPFSSKDDGGDLVETALMIQGLLTVKEYLDPRQTIEAIIGKKIQRLWEEVEWNWYTRGGQNVLYWHWSPNFGWDMNLPIQGYNESLIVYVLAAGSPTYPISKDIYDRGWARNGQMRNGNTFNQMLLPLGEDFGGPLFFSHYSFLGLDPRNLKDAYADYSLQGKNHTLINRAHAIQNPRGFAGYYENSWGFTASDNHLGYNAHSPINDLGVITPTAALSSFPYTPKESMDALKFFYYGLGDRIWGPFGFYDAFNVTESWYADSYLAIDQGPILLMIENHRTGLLWRNFMKNLEVKKGLTTLGFTY